MRDRVVVVTGSSSGIGEAIATRFADEGALVVVNSRDDARAREAAGRLGGGDRVLAVAADVSTEAGATALVARAVERFGRLDVLVNNAGMPMVRQSEALAAADWQACLDLNLTGAFLCARAAAPGMRGQGKGSIVNVASVAGLTGLPYRAAYCATKSGLLGLTQSLAAEWAQHGIRVNAVAPAFIETPLSAFIAASPDEVHGDWSYRAIAGRTPLGRMGRPEEVAAAAVFLASDDASYITGCALPVDGGWLAFGGWTEAAHPPAPVDRHPTRPRPETAR